MILLNVDAVNRALTYLPIYLELKLQNKKVALLAANRETANLLTELGAAVGDIFNSWHNVPISSAKSVVFLSSDIPSGEIPSGSKSVTLLHSLPLVGELKKDYSNLFKQKPTLMYRSDYVLLPIMQSPDAWNSKKYEKFTRGMFSSSMLGGSERSVGVIQAGYPKIDYLARTVTNGKFKDKIIYCPTNSKIGAGEVVRHGEFIIKSLLDAFPDCNVVFRPYPGPKLPPFVQRFSSNDRFILDTSLTGIEHQIDARFCVSDNSSAAITFALASGKPSVFCEFDNNSIAHSEKDVPRELGFGYYVNSKNSFFKILKKLEKSVDFYRDAILNYGASCIPNFKCSAQRIASLLDSIHEGRVIEECLDVKVTSYQHEGLTNAECASRRRKLWAKNNTWQKVSVLSDPL